MHSTNIVTRVPAVMYRTVEIDGQTIFYREAGSPESPVAEPLQGA